MIVTRTLLIAAILALPAEAPNAQPNWKIELFSDAEMSTCAINYSVPGIFQIHIFHTGDEPSIGVSFALYEPECLTGAFWIGDRVNPDFLPLQNTHDVLGLAVSYRECVEMPAYVGYVQYYATAAAQPCCEVRVSDPIHTAIDMVGVTCDGLNGFTPVVDPAILNANANCPCEHPVAVESTTWGRVKALYR